MMTSYSDYSNQGNAEVFFQVGAYRIKDDPVYDKDRKEDIHVFTIDKGQDTGQLRVILTNSSLRKVMKMTPEEQTAFCKNVVKAAKASEKSGFKELGDTLLNEVEFTGKKEFKLIKSKLPISFQKTLETVSKNETPFEMKEKDPGFERILIVPYDNSATAAKENQSGANVSSLQQPSSPQKDVSSEEINMAIFGESSEPTVASAAPASSIPSIENKALNICTNINYFRDIYSTKNLDIRTKNNSGFENVKKQLLELSAEIRKNPSEESGLHLVISDKLDRLSTFVNDHFEAEQEVDLGDTLELWQLDLQKIVKELRELPREGSSLNVVGDKTTRTFWLEKLGEEYSVDYKTFYDRLILGLFPEMEGNEDFQRFVSDYLINPLGDEKITAYSWRQFVEFFGPLEELRENVLKLYQNPSFVGNMSRGVSESQLLRFHTEHRGTPTKSLIRLSINQPGRFILSYSQPTGRQGERRLLHTAFLQLSDVIRTQSRLEAEAKLHPFRSQTKK